MRASSETAGLSTFAALRAPNFCLYWWGLVFYVLGHRAEYTTFAWITVALVVVALAGYLIAIAWELLDTRRSVAAIADGLEVVRDHTGPLPEKLTTINGALGALLGGLEAADRHLGRAAPVFRRP